MSKSQKKEKKESNPDPKVLETTEQIFNITNKLKASPEPVKAVDAWGKKQK